MGADWYSPFVLFGSSVTIPDGKSYTSFLRFLQSLALDHPFQIQGMLSEFHSRMEGMYESDYESLTDNATIVIGFAPSNDMMINCERAEKLKSYLLEHDILKTYSFDVPTFHTGIDWEGNPYESETDEETLETAVPLSTPFTPAKTVSVDEMNSMFFHA
jgi:hypothetical protein